MSDRAREVLYVLCVLALLLALGAGIANSG